MRYTPRMKIGEPTFHPAPEDAPPLYVLEDDEGNKFVYVGEDTFTRLPDGPEKDHWMRKMAENKVTAHEIAGAMIYPVDHD